MRTLLNDNPYQEYPYINQEYPYLKTLCLLTE